MEILVALYIGYEAFKLLDTKAFKDKVDETKNMETIKFTYKIILLFILEVFYVITLILLIVYGNLFIKVLAGCVFLSSFIAHILTHQERFKCYIWPYRLDSILSSIILFLIYICY